MFLHVLFLHVLFLCFWPFLHFDFGWFLFVRTSFFVILFCSIFLTSFFDPLCALHDINSHNIQKLKTITEPGK